MFYHYILHDNSCGHSDRIMAYLALFGSSAYDSNVRRYFSLYFIQIKAMKKVISILNNEKRIIEKQLGNLPKDVDAYVAEIAADNIELLNELSEAIRVLSSKPDCCVVRRCDKCGKDTLHRVYYSCFECNQKTK